MGPVSLRLLLLPPLPLQLHQHLPQRTPQQPRPLKAQRNALLIRLILGAAVARTVHLDVIGDVGHSGKIAAADAASTLHRDAMGGAPSQECLIKAVGVEIRHQRHVAAEVRVQLAVTTSADQQRR